MVRVSSASAPTSVLSEERIQWQEKARYYILTIQDAVLIEFSRRTVAAIYRGGVCTRMNGPDQRDSGLDVIADTLESAWLATAGQLDFDGEVRNETGKAFARVAVFEQFLPAYE